jgi:sugar fermentation stimulation protein A
MRLPPLVPARFVRRENRFRVTVERDGAPVAAHLPNSGRLTELLTPGRACWLAHRAAQHRKTDFDLALVEYAGVLVSVDARLPNRLFAEALDAGALAPFSAYQAVEREVRRGESRLDFRLSGGDAAPCWTEVKSVTLVEDGLARFPDAPTARGSRHVGELSRIVASGERAAVVFVVQRPDARRFAPHDEADPAFGRALRDAAARGVAVWAWTCIVTQEQVEINCAIPVELPEMSSTFLSS